jgi:hypothetical protein
VSAYTWVVPEGAETPMGAALDAVAALSRRYVVMSDEQAATIALWVTHTHCFDAADYTPYLFITSAERESGKSLLKEVCELLVRNPVSTSNVSPAALFRIASPEEEPEATFLVDEVDEIFAPKSERSELRGLLNAGFHRGDHAIRMVGEGANQKPYRFPVFCPKLLAGRNSAVLGDTLESRCIRIELKRKTRDERVERFRRRDVDAAALAVHETLRSLAEYHLDDLAAARPVLPEELSDRQWDIWEPLLAVAELAGAEWGARARAAAVALVTGIAPDDSLGVRLLADCREALNGHQRTPTAQLIEVLCLMEEAPWGEKWWDSYKGEQKRGAAANLAWHLRRYAIHSKKIRFEDGPLQGYERDDFEDAWSRYLPPAAPDAEHSEQPASDGGLQPIPSRNTAEECSGLEEGANRHGAEDVPDVPAETLTEQERAALRDLTTRKRIEKEDAEREARDAQLREEFQTEADYWSARLQAHESGEQS